MPKMPTGKALLEIKDGEGFHMMIQGINPGDSRRGWRLLSKRRKDGKIEAVIYFGSFDEDGIIKTKENIMKIVASSAEKFNDGIADVLCQMKKVFPTAEVRVLNLQGLTMEQTINKIRESDFAYVWQQKKEGGEKK